MIVTKLVLKNWRNFSSVDVALGDRVFLVGPNAAGKSNFLEVFRFLRDIANAPLDRLTVTIMGSISGVSPTATAMANRKASIQSCLESPLIRNTAGTITAMKPIISHVNLLMPLSKLVSWRCPTILAASEPK